MFHVIDLDTAIWLGERLYLGGSVIIAVKASSDFVFGADSPLARYIIRPFAHLILREKLYPKDKYQMYMAKARQEVNEVGFTKFARVVTWPYTPKYEEYRANTSDIENKV